MTKHVTPSGTTNEPVSETLLIRGYTHRSRRRTPLIAAVAVAVVAVALTVVLHAGADDRSGGPAAGAAAGTPRTASAVAVAAATIEPAATTVPSVAVASMPAQVPASGTPASQTASKLIPATNPGVGVPGIFLGFWTGHGRELRVNADASAIYLYRTYVTCGSGVPQPCDTVSGNSITDGGKLWLRMLTVTTANHSSTATLRVVASSDPTYPVGSTQTMKLTGDVIASAELGSLCDTKGLDAGQCGA